MAKSFYGSREQTTRVSTRLLSKQTDLSTDPCFFYMDWASVPSLCNGGESHVLAAPFCEDRWGDKYFRYQCLAIGT